MRQRFVGNCLSVGPTWEFWIEEKYIWEADSQADSSGSNLQDTRTRSFNTCLFCTCSVLGMHVLVAGGASTRKMELGHAFEESEVRSGEDRGGGPFPFHLERPLGHTNGKP